MEEIAGSPDVALRSFVREDFGRLMSWVWSEAALVEWCAGFFRHPLDEAQLDRYLESSKQPNARAIRSPRRAVAIRLATSRSARYGRIYRAACPGSWLRRTIDVAASARR